MSSPQEKTIRVTFDFTFMIDEKPIDDASKTSYLYEGVTLLQKKLFQALLREGNTKLQQVLLDLVAQTLSDEDINYWRELLLGEELLDDEVLMKGAEALNEEDQKEIGKWLAEDPRTSYLFTQPFWACFQLKSSSNSVELL
jgi:hypothetical protein